jgi:hypothetical protein
MTEKSRPGSAPNFSSFSKFTRTLQIATKLFSSIVAPSNQST